MCELLVQRIGLIASMRYDGFSILRKSPQNLHTSRGCCRSPPDDLQEAMASILYCAHRVEIPELREIGYAAALHVLVSTHFNPVSSL